MLSVGVDIGTTSICAVLYENQTDTVIRTLKRDHAFLPDKEEGAFAQDAEEIVCLVKAMLEELLPGQEEVGRIAFSSQMHGILGIDENGAAVTPFYTWKNRFGGRMRGNETYAGYFERVTGSRCGNGYGMAVLLYLAENGLLPRSVKKICGIGDYAVMKLTGNKEPLMHTTIAESLGGFDAEHNRFLSGALERAGIETALLPEVTARQSVCGMYKTAKVYAALGDNQCSYMGSVKSCGNSVCINVGTGSQVSAYSEALLDAGSCEVRTFPGGGCLYVCASPNGGKVFELLGDFISECCRVFADTEIDFYDRWNVLEESGYFQEASENGSGPVVEPVLYGGSGRQHETGSITMLTDSNFKLKNFLMSYIRGMAEELWRMYQRLPEEIRKKENAFVMAGNGILKNRALQKALEYRFGCSLICGEAEEAAAAGAVKFTGK